MNQLHHRILSVLYDGDACLETMGKGGSLHNGRTLDKLLNKGGKPVLEKGVDINRVVRVEQMVIQKVEGSGQTKEAEVWVTIKKLGEANKGSGEILKKFPLTVELDTAGKIASCHHTLDSKEHGIKTRMCEEMGGEMITVPGTPTTACTLTNVYKTFCESLEGVYTAPASGTPVGKCNIKDTYVDQDGDTMTGTLTAPDGSKIGGCSESGGSWSCPQNLSAGATVNAANASVSGTVNSASVNASGNIAAGGTVSAGGAGGGGSGNGVTTDPTRTNASVGDSSSLNISCPSGEVMTGISNGLPLCVSLSEGKGGDGKCIWTDWYNIVYYNVDDTSPYPCSSTLGGNRLANLHKSPLTRFCPATHPIFKEKQYNNNSSFETYQCPDSFTASGHEPGATTYVNNVRFQCCAL